MSDAYSMDRARLHLVRRWAWLSLGGLVALGFFLAWLWPTAPTLADLAGLEVARFLVAIGAGNLPTHIVGQRIGSEVLLQMLHTVPAGATPALTHFLAVLQHREAVAGWGALAVSITAGALSLAIDRQHEPGDKKRRKPAAAEDCLRASVYKKIEKESEHV